MSSEPQPALKRGRTASKSRGFESPSEELSHVANLVERRRVQNRISQRNYRNKIRNRLEKLEALVETNKAQQQSQSGSPSTTPDMPRGSVDISPPATRGEDLALQNDPPRSVSKTCMCALGDFDPSCSCGGMSETVRPLLDPINSFPNFMETDGTESLYINLPSPESLHCNTPTTPFQDELLKLENISVNGSMAEQGSNPASHSRERLDTSLLSLDMPPSQPLQPPYDRFHGQFVPMGYHMVPMSYMATSDSVMQNGASGRTWNSIPTTYPSGMQSAIPLSSMQHYILTPTPVMMVPMHHPMSPQHTSDTQPQTSSQ